MITNFPTFLFSQSSVGGERMSNPLGPHLTTYNIVGSAIDSLVPSTTAYNQKSSVVQASMGQSCFGGKRRTTSILGWWS